MRELIAGIAFVCLALFGAARADNFPSRTITLIVPYPPGGSTDVAGRILADKMGAALGEPVIVENVGGAGGSIGVGRLARSAPDGYTIDIGQWDTHVGGIIYNLNYDLAHDFAPIGLVSLNPQLLVARKSFSHAAIADLTPDDILVPPGFTRTLGSDRPVFDPALDEQAAAS